MFIKMRWQDIVLRASEYLLTRCEWFLRREEIRLKMAYCWKANFFGLLQSIRKTNVEFAKNGDSQDNIFVLLSALILKPCPCCHLCPKSGLISEKSPLLPPLSKNGLISENSPLLPPLSKRGLREQSLSMTGTRAKEICEKQKIISYSLKKYSKHFIPHKLFHKTFYTPTYSWTGKLSYDSADNVEKFNRSFHHNIWPMTTG